MGTFIVLKAISNAMIAQKPQGGSIVQTASMAAHSGPPNMIAYGSSKAAVHHMTRTWRHTILESIQSVQHSLDLVSCGDDKLSCKQRQTLFIMIKIQML